MQTFLHRHHKRHFLTLTAVLNMLQWEIYVQVHGQGYLFFRTVVTPSILRLSFTQRSLEGLFGSCGLLLAVSGLNTGEMKLLSHLLVITGSTYGSPTSLGTPRWVSSCCLQYFFKVFPIISHLQSQHQFCAVQSPSVAYSFCPSSV